MLTFRKDILTPHEPVESRLHNCSKIRRHYSARKGNKDENQSCKWKVPKFRDSTVIFILFILKRRVRQVTECNKLILGFLNKIYLSLKKPRSLRSEYTLAQIIWLVPQNSINVAFCMRPIEKPYNSVLTERNKKADLNEIRM